MTRIEFERRYHSSTGRPFGELQRRSARGTFREIAGQAGKAWFCTACGDRLPSRHLVGSDCYSRLHLNGCSREAAA